MKMKIEQKGTIALVKTNLIKHEFAEINTVLSVADLAFCSIFYHLK